MVWLILNSRIAWVAAAVMILAAGAWWVLDEAGDRREAELEAERAQRQVESLNRLREIEKETRDASDNDLRRELGIGLRD